MIEKIMQEYKKKKALYQFLGWFVLLMLIINSSDIINYFSGPKVEEASYYFYSVLVDEMK